MRKWSRPQLNVFECFGNLHFRRTQQYQNSFNVQVCAMKCPLLNNSASVASDALSCEVKLVPLPTKFCHPFLFTMKLQLAFPKKTRVVQGDVPDDATAMDLSLIIQSEIAVPEGSRIRCVFNGRIMKEDTPLTSYGVTNGSTVYIVIPGFRPPPESPRPAPTVPVPSSPPRPAPADGVKDLWDPSLPDFCRRTDGQMAVNIQYERTLCEMGYPLRKVRNALRFMRNNISTAEWFLSAGLFDDEESNFVTEQYHAGAIGDATYNEKFMPKITATAKKMWKKQQQAKSGQATGNQFDYWSGGQGAWPGQLQQMGFGDWGQQPKVEEVVSQPLEPILRSMLNGTGALTLEEENSIGSNMRSCTDQQRASMCDLVQTIRSAASAPDQTFRNPFAVLYFKNTLAKELFGKDLEFAAMLNTAEVRFVIEHMKTSSLADICTKMRQYNNDLSRVGAELQPTFW